MPRQALVALIARAAAWAPLPMGHGERSRRGRDARPLAPLGHGRLRARFDWAFCDWPKARRGAATLKVCPLLVVLGVAAMQLVGSRSAFAQPTCRASLAPSPLAVRETGLDSNRVACGVDGFAVGTRGQAVIDTPEHEGVLGGSLFLDAQWLHETGFEFSLGVRLVDYRFAQSANFTDGEYSLGPITVGVLRPRHTSLWGYSLVTAHALRFELPFTNIHNDDLTITASPSLLATMMVSSRLHLHARSSVLLWSVLPAAGPDSRAALLASSDVAYAVFPLLAVTVGTEVQGGWYGLGLDHLLARVGMRASIGSEGAIEFSAASILAGSEQTDFVVWLGYRRFATKQEATKKSRLQEWAR